MFSSEQIEFMRSLGLNFDFEHLTDDEYMKIEDVVGDAYTEEAQRYPVYATKKIRLCEDILAELS